jgi:hypothetical protein
MAAVAAVAQDRFACKPRHAGVCHWKCHFGKMAARMRITLDFLLSTSFATGKAAIRCSKNRRSTVASAKSNTDLGPRPSGVEATRSSTSVRCTRRSPRCSREAIRSAAWRWNRRRPATLSSIRTGPGTTPCHRNTSNESTWRGEKSKSVTKPPRAGSQAYVGRFHFQRKNR